VRSGWIYGEHGGTNFLSVMHNLLAEGKKIKAISDSYGTPTFAKDLATQIARICRIGFARYLSCDESGKGATFEEFALEVCRLKEFDVNLIETVSMKDLRRPAPRPVSSRLACLFSEKFGLSPLQNWEKALSEFLIT
jgi:dTDP-4-dehydrorhamnose reductase